MRSDASGRLDACSVPSVSFILPFPLPIRAIFVKRETLRARLTTAGESTGMWRRSGRTLRLIVLPACLCVAPAGCRPAGPPPAKAQTGGARSETARSEQEDVAQEDVAQDDVALALNWFPEAEHGGYFAALVHGYYKQAGLKVKILPGGPNAPVLQRVASRQVAFGIENADRVLLARAQEADAIAVMAPLQKSPRAIMVHAESKFERIDHLDDVTLAVNSGAAWMQYLKKKVPLRNVRLVP
jgi:ABC-type nitrate/sulfonate/bicarbonate transport system substrate-binding protein